MSKKKSKAKNVDIGERRLKYMMDGGRLMIDGQLVRSKSNPEPTPVRTRRRTKKRSKRRVRIENTPSSMDRFNSEYKKEVARKRREEKRARS